MTATLFYSLRCEHCVNLLNFIQSKPPLHDVSNFIDVNKQRLPGDVLNKIQAVPALITNDGKVLSGKELKMWYESLLPDSVSGFGDEAIGTCSIGDEPDSSRSSMYDLDSYGAQLAPHITPELQEKISMNVNDAFNKRNGN
tara:strand:+ start:5310 stop:5732 length:423 start_codon:yes stop_codon:yes gene_type:complete